MIEREQIRHLCEFNRRLARENSLLRIRLRNAEQKLRELEREHANLATERDAVDAALGAAIDEALKARQR